MKMIKDLGTRHISKDSKWKKRFAIYECPNCFTHNEHQVQNVKNGKTTQCISCAIKSRSLKKTTHSLSHTPLHNTWSNMKQRCYNKKNEAYQWYGEKGVTVCDEWRNSSELFIEWSLENGYKPGLTIDRKNNNGNYNPNNCRWVNSLVQGQNKGKPKRNTSGYKGVSKVKNGWISRITVNKKEFCLGTFNEKIDAAKAYNKFIDDNNLEHQKERIQSKMEK